MAPQVPLLADDGAILLDVYSDGSVAELYWMNGRVAMYATFCLGFHRFWLSCPHFGCSELLLHGQVRQPRACLFVS